MMPIFGAVIEVVLDGRRLRINLVAGILLALSGGLLATGVNIFEAQFGLGALICLIAVCLFAWAFISGVLRPSTSESSQSC